MSATYNKSKQGSNSQKLAVVVKPNRGRGVVVAERGGE